jgi:hypothetical protein
LLVSLAQEQWHRGWLARRFVHASLAWCVVLRRAFLVSTARLAKGGCCMLVKGHRPSGCGGGDVSHGGRCPPHAAKSAMNHAAEGAWYCCCCWRWRPPSPCHPWGRSVVDPSLLPGRPHWEQGRSGSRWDTSCLLYLPPMLCRALPWI